MVNVLFGKFRFLCTLLRGKKKEIVYNCYQLQTRHLTEISAEQANMRLYIYIPQWWSSCIGFVRAWIAANCTTDQCNRSQPCENGNFTRIYRLFDWPTYTSHLTSRNTVVHIHTHTHTVPRKMHAMREIFLRYLKIVRVLQGRSLGIRFTGFLFEVFRLKKKSESSAQSMGIFSFIDREKRIWSLDGIKLCSRNYIDICKFYDEWIMILLFLENFVYLRFP